eukprot:607069-Pelagomonas_calceolata.AAC.8
MQKMLITPAREMSVELVLHKENGDIEVRAAIDNRLVEHQDVLYEIQACVAVGLKALICLQRLQVGAVLLPEMLVKISLDAARFLFLEVVNITKCSNLAHRATSTGLEGVFSQRTSLLHPLLRY